jgi:hypothetical protein
MEKRKTINYSNLTSIRIFKLSHFSEQEKQDLIKILSLSDDELKKHNNSQSKGIKQNFEDDIKYHDYYDDKTNKSLEIAKDNEL